MDSAMGEMQVGRTTGRVRNYADRRARRTYARLAKRRPKGRNIVGGRIVVKTPTQRRAAIEAGRRIRRVALRPNVQRKAGRTRRWNRRFGIGERGDQVRHNDLFLAAVNEFVVRTGRPDIGRALVEAIDPRLTSTPIGVLAMDAAELLAEMPQVNRAFVDVIVLDEQTFGVFFEPMENINDAALERALTQFGEVDVLVRPGEDIDESTTADLYMIAVTVPENRLEDVKVVENTDDEEGASVIDESQDLSEDAFKALIGHSCFEELVRG